MTVKQTEKEKLVGQHALTINEIRDIGSHRLPKMYREWFNGGAMDMLTIADNEEAFNRYKLRPRILRNVRDIDTSTTLFGQKVNFPLVFSPAAMHQIAHPDGEVATSRAAAKFGISMIVSAYSTKPLEDVIAQANGNPYGMQVSVLRDRRTTLQILKRAEKAGYKAVFVVVDAPILGRRLNEHRNNFALPKGMGWPNLLADESNARIDGGDGHAAYDPTADWATAIPWLKANTNLEIWIKGGASIHSIPAPTIPSIKPWQLYPTSLMHQLIPDHTTVTSPYDIHLAATHSLTGVLISNHGGRQLDTVPATIDCLRDCADAIAATKGTLRIGMDGGVRRGTDIFKAMALGAEFVGVGRVPIWGLAYDGQKGVEHALQILLDEFRTCMALTGCRTIQDITREHLSVLGPRGELCKL